MAEHHPDAILLGLHMPVIDGIQAILLAAARVGSTLYADQTRDLPDGLTAREAEILALIARGMTNPRSRRPGPEQSHGQEHINRIFAMTRSRDRAAATQYAQAHNLSWG